jgi:hypothetical protein
MGIGWNYKRGESGTSMGGNLFVVGAGHQRKWLLFREVRERLLRDLVYIEKDLATATR